MILAGIIIGLGVIVNTLMENPLAGSFLFSLGLLSIIELKLPLYTGKVGFLNILWEQKYKILICNLIGIGLTIFFYCIANNNFTTLLQNAAQIKFSKSILTLFINAVFCGILIHIAVRTKKPLITVLCVMVFILIKAEHCIADFPYFCLNLSFINLCKYIAIIIGNSIGAIATEKLISN